MANDPRSTRGTILALVRGVTALALAFFGGVFACGSFLEMHWQRHPWAGQAGTSLEATLYGLLGVALLIGPMVAWWFLLPRARWWGIPATLFLPLAVGTVVLVSNT